MKNLPIYCFEGTANIVCEKCKRKHTLIFPVVTVKLSPRLFRMPLILMVGKLILSSVLIAMKSMMESLL